MATDPFEERTKALSPRTTGRSRNWQLLQDPETLYRESGPNFRRTLNQAIFEKLYIDEGDSGLITPTVGIPIAVGEHLIELRNSNGDVGASTRVKIEKGQTAHIVLDFSSPKR